MIEFAELIQHAASNGTVGSLILAACLVLLGIVVKGMMENKGTKDVAKIQSETTLSAKAMDTMTAAMEFLKEENKTLKTNMAQIESHMDTLIELILEMLKAENQEEADAACMRLEQFLKSIGRWPY